MLTDMGAPPRFSILLPTHNRADVLPFAIRSALAQTEGDFELLIAGDGCTDPTPQVVAGFPDPRIRWFDLRKAPGIGYATRNVALRQARGRHVAYLAHDDIWFPDHLSRLGEQLERPGIELAYSRGLAVGLDGRMLPYWFNLGVRRHQAGLGRGDSAITLCSIAHTRECLAKYGFWDEGLLRSADIAFVHRIGAGAGFRNVAFLSDPTSLHFVAGWRNTRQHRIRAGVTNWLTGSFLDEVLAGPLTLQYRPGETQQETAWKEIACRPLERPHEWRAAVVQLHDALLWRARPPVGLIGLRAGLAAGAALDGLMRRVRRLASPRTRRVFRALDAATRPHDKRR